MARGLKIPLLLAGQAAEYVCNPSTQQFEGPGVSCTKIACKENELPSGFDTSACANLVAGDFCLVSCQAGFVPAAEKYTCGVDGSFSGSPPSCERVVCPADSLPVAPGVNVSACVGTVTGQSCDVTCAFGFEGTASSYSCGLDGAFTGTVPSCARKTCAVPSDFSSSALSHDCNGILHGARCTVSCAAGYYGTPKEQLGLTNFVEVDLQEDLCSSKARATYQIINAMYSLFSRSVFCIFFLNVAGILLSCHSGKSAVMEAWLLICPAAQRLLAPLQE